LTIVIFSKLEVRWYCTIVTGTDEGSKENEVEQDLKTVVNLHLDTDQGKARSQWRHA
jgi:hypothetical protein